MGPCGPQPDTKGTACAMQSSCDAMLGHMGQVTSLNPLKTMNQNKHFPSLQCSCWVWVAAFLRQVISIAISYTRGRGREEEEKGDWSRLQPLSPPVGLASGTAPGSAVSQATKGLEYRWEGSDCRHERFLSLRGHVCTT